jgi:hypothetical protein
MRAARIRLTKEWLLDLLHLPPTLSIEAQPAYSTERPRVLDFYLEGEELGAAFQVPDGEMIPEASLEYAHTYDAEGELLKVRLLAIRRV